MQTDLPRFIPNNLFLLFMLNHPEIDCIEILSHVQMPVSNLLHICSFNIFMWLSTLSCRRQILQLPKSTPSLSVKQTLEPPKSDPHQTCCIDLLCILLRVGGFANLMVSGHFPNVFPGKLTRRHSLVNFRGDIGCLVGLTTQMQNATFFWRKGPERKPWLRRKPPNEKKHSQCVFAR